MGNSCTRTGSTTTTARTRSRTPTIRVPPATCSPSPNGTYTYPTGPGYDNDAADLVEFRVKPLTTMTAFRITMNTLQNPSLIAFSIAIGGAPGHVYPFPDGANVTAPAQPVPDRPPVGIEARGRARVGGERRSRRRAGADREGRPASTADRGRRPASRLEPRPRHRPAGDGRRPVGQRERALSAAAGNRQRDRAWRRRCGHRIRRPSSTSRSVQTARSRCPRRPPG